MELFRTPSVRGAIFSSSSVIHRSGLVSIFNQFPCSFECVQVCKEIFILNLYFSVTNVFIFHSNVLIQFLNFNQFRLYSSVSRYKSVCTEVFIVRISFRNIFPVTAEAVVLFSCICLICCLFKVKPYNRIIICFSFCIL